MNKIEKLLSKLSNKERAVLRAILSRIHSRSYKNLNIKKLRGNLNLFRVRKGDIRIIFRVEKDVRILSISRRNDNTYDLG